MPHHPRGMAAHGTVSRTESPIRAHSLTTLRQRGAGRGKEETALLDTPLLAVPGQPPHQSNRAAASATRNGGHRPEQGPSTGTVPEGSRPAGTGPVDNTACGRERTQGSAPAHRHPRWHDSHAGCHPICQRPGRGVRHQRAAHRALPVPEPQHTVHGPRAPVQPHTHTPGADAHRVEHSKGQQLPEGQKGGL